MGTETRPGAPFLLASLPHRQHLGHSSVPAGYAGNPSSHLPAAERTLPVIMTPGQVWPLIHLSSPQWGPGQQGGFPLLTPGAASREMQG